MLELKNVTKLYQTKSGKVCALNGINLTFPSNGMVFITGKSGCGKTTLLNVIGGLDGVDSGEISILGKSFSRFTPTEYDSYRNTFIGFVFQEYNLLPEFTVEKNIKIAMELQGDSVNDSEFNSLLETVEITNLKNRKINELSGGQRQRVAIARALVKKPRIIMADEPTGALDSATGIQVLEILKKLSKDKLVIVVSHDQDFAEKYADRIIRLIDGTVVEDFSFSEKEINKNVQDNDEFFIVKHGADLSCEEKDALALAIKNKKKIEITEKLSYREKKKTEKVETTVSDKGVTFKSSKMKLKSSLALGLKSLGVKPLRLVFTILLSAVAFAVFGLFDTVANFSTAKVINNLLKNTPYPSITTYGEYVIDEKDSDKYEVRFSQEAIDALSKKTGLAMKGVYDFENNTNGFVRPTYSIQELSSSSVTLGKNYYVNSVNGIMEFSDNEISESGRIGNLGYKLVHGEYPSFRYDSNGKLIASSVNEIAISTFLAESICYRLDGQPLNGLAVNEYSDIVGKDLTINGQKFKVVGLIDCGKIDKKYDVLKNSTVSNVNTRTLVEDFNTYINSGAFKCIFTASGFLKHLNKSTNGATIYYTGNSVWTISHTNAVPQNAYKYVYSVRGYDQNNVLLFSQNSSTDNKIALSDDEVLIHVENVRALFRNEYNDLDANSKDKIISNVKDISSPYLNLSISEKTQKLNEILSLLTNENERIKTINVTKTSAVTDKKINKPLKVVGVYYGIDTNYDVSWSTYKFMMNDNLMQEFDIFSEQGDFSRIIFSTKGNLYGSKIISEYMTANHGLSLNWYGNSALSTIKLNEQAIRQSADLFLYVAVVLALFSVFMFFNYIVTSIVNKRPSIGILRALGSGRKDVLLMFICESVIIALINAVLATLLTALGCVFVNMYINNVMNISIPFAIFGIRQLFIILGISVFTAIASSTLPIIKISKEKPVDLIRKP